MTDTVIDLQLTAGAAISLTQQIVKGVEEKVQAGALRSGQRIPSVRGFAVSQGISVHTVVEAYGHLVARGVLISRRGSGYFVADQSLQHQNSTFARLRDSLDPSQLGREILADSPASVRLGGGPVSSDWVDHIELEAAFRKLARGVLPRFNSYGTTLGFAPLRELLSRRFANADVQVSPSNIMLTNGATQALDLVIRLLVRPEQTVLVDDPGYFQTFWALKTQGARLVGVPRNKDGPDIAAFERLCAESNATLFFTQSVLQNPTGGSISLSVAHELLRVADRHGVLIVEDDVSGDLAPSGATRLMMLDGLRRVVYVGSFSKTLSPSLRVGFVASGNSEHLDGLAQLKLVSCYASCEPNEAIVYSLLVDGHYSRHLRRLCRRLEERAATAIPALEQHGFTLAAPYTGGTFIWASHRDYEDSMELARQASKAGILLAPGGAFRPQGESSAYLRFSLPLCTQRGLHALSEFLTKTYLPPARQAQRSASGAQG